MGGGAANEFDAIVIALCQLALQFRRGSADPSADLGVTGVTWTPGADLEVRGVGRGAMQRPRRAAGNTCPIIPRGAAEIYK